MKSMKFLSILMLLGGSLQGGPVLTLSPAHLHILPGSSGSIFFTMKADQTNWVTAVSSFILTQTDPTFGIYDDVIGALGGPVDAVLAPGSPDWSDQLGIYFVSPDPATAVNSGTIRVLYEEFSGDPNACVECYLGPGSFDVEFEITTIPEPGTWLSLAAGGALLAMLRRLR